MRELYLVKHRNCKGSPEPAFSYWTAQSEVSDDEKLENQKKNSLI